MPESREPRDGPVIRVERPDVQVMFVEVADRPEEIRRGWTLLEDTIGSLRGRKFLGAFDEAVGRYRACVQVTPDDDPASLGLSTGVVPGGAYARARLRGEPEELYQRIPSTFAALEASVERDRDRPGIEVYRRHGEVDLLVPLAIS